MGTPAAKPSVPYRRPSYIQTYEIPDRSEMFAAFKAELQDSPHYSNLKDRDLDAVLSSADWLAYKVPAIVRAALDDRTTE